MIYNYIRRTCFGDSMKKTWGGRQVTYADRQFERVEKKRKKERAKNDLDKNMIPARRELRPHRYHHHFLRWASQCELKNTPAMKKKRLHPFPYTVLVSNFPSSCAGPFQRISVGLSNIALTQLDFSNREVQQLCRQGE